MKKLIIFVIILSILSMMWTGCTDLEAVEAAGTESVSTEDTMLNSAQDSEIRSTLPWHIATFMHNMAIYAVSIWEQTGDGPMSLEIKTLLDDARNCSASTITDNVIIKSDSGEYVLVAAGETLDNGLCGLTRFSCRIESGVGDPSTCVTLWLSAIAGATGETTVNTDAIVSLLQDYVDSYTGPDYSATIGPAYYNGWDLELVVDSQGDMTLRGTCNFPMLIPEFEFLPVEKPQVTSTPSKYLTTTYTKKPKSASVSTAVPTNTLSNEKDAIIEEIIDAIIEEEILGGAPPWKQSGGGNKVVIEQEIWEIEAEFE